VTGTTGEHASAPATADLVHGLGEGEPPAVALVGGKAASVDRLARLGFRTPPGFSLTAAAHRAYRDGAGLTERYDGLRSRLPDEEARTGLEGLARAEPLPGALRAALEERVAALSAALPDGARLAVRSSAIDEDGVSASFAGAHESVLGVECNAAAVEEAVRTCWASLWSPGAIAYRERRSLGFETEMAVVVQALVEAEGSAVAFTKDPVTGSTRELLVATCESFGEGIMAGGEDAVTFRVDRGTRALIEVEGASGPWPISLADLNRLVEIVLEVERSYECPVDVEAAFDGEEWTLVQARPVTT
jgi:pyruvate,water dikinase